MTDYLDDFRTTDVGSPPAGWTIVERGGDEGEFTATVETDATALGGKVLKISPTDAATKIAWYFLTLNAVASDPDRANAEIELRYKVANTSNANNHDLFALARGDTLGGTRSFHALGNRYNGRVAISETVNSNQTFIASVNKTIVADTWYRLNARVVDSGTPGETTLEVTQWDEATTRPSVPDASATGEDITGEQLIGMNLFSSIDGDILVDWFSVTTGGGDAATPGNVTQLSSATAQADGATAFTGSVRAALAYGSVYYVVTESATKPSVAQVKAGQDHNDAAAVFADNQVVSALGVQSLTGGGLAGETTYHLHAVWSDGTDDSDVISSSSFTTPVGALPTPTNLSATNIQADSATLTWDRGV